MAKDGGPLPRRFPENPLQGLAFPFRLGWSTIQQRCRWPLTEFGMSKRSACVLAGALAASTAVMPLSPVQAQDLASPMIPPKVNTAEVPQEVKAAWGCVLMGTAGTIAAVGASSVNMLNVVAGGVVLPANPTVLVLGLAGVVFTSFCTMGQQLTPLYTYYFHEEPAPQFDTAKPQVPHGAGNARLAALDDEDATYPWQSAK